MPQRTPTLQFRTRVAVVDYRGAAAGPFQDVEVGFDNDQTEGNVYVYVDGHEVGSLFLERNEDGEVQISFGAYDDASQMWEYASDHSRRSPTGSGLRLPVMPEAAEIERS